MKTTLKIAALIAFSLISGSLSHAQEGSPPTKDWPTGAQIRYVAEYHVPGEANVLLSMIQSMEVKPDCVFIELPIDVQPGLDESLKNTEMRSLGQFMLRAQENTYGALIRQNDQDKTYYEQSISKIRVGPAGANLPVVPVSLELFKYSKEMGIKFFAMDSRSDSTDFVESTKTVLTVNINGYTPELLWYMSERSKFMASVIEARFNDRSCTRVIVTVGALHLHPGFAFQSLLHDKYPSVKSIQEWLEPTGLVGYSPN